MRYFALCCDYDGTIAHHGRVSDETIEALRRVKASGRKVLLVTGRELDDLQTVFSDLELFDRIVAENGALLYRPAKREEKVLAPPPPERFVAELRARGVERISVGRSIVATWEPHETVVLETIRDQGLDLQVIFNKGAVMVLPAGVNKASGLVAALDELDLSPHNAIGVGDAENDHAFLNLCECSVAVSNALPSLKERVDLIMQGDHGKGVEELVEMLLADDLRAAGTRLSRHRIPLGQGPEDEEITLCPHGENILLVGTSGSGKSTAATGIMERLAERAYNFCVIDPEGDYDELDGAVALGTTDRAPTLDEVMQLLSQPRTNAVINLIGLPLADRPGSFRSLWPHVQELRTRTGQPHWLVLDEAHHVLPADGPDEEALAAPLDSALLISVHPGLVARAALAEVDTLIVVGAQPAGMIREFAEAIGQKPPAVPAEPLPPGEAMVWFRSQGRAPVRVRLAPSHTERRRHLRKYAEGELPEDRSFYFRGPEGKLKLRAQNLILFLQLAEGVDDETWLHHLRRKDYSSWVAQAIKDEGLAEEIKGVESRKGLSAQASREAIRAAIEENYTLPAG
jgi:HAD superfamily hydrolase (TIGR01484 family)